MRNAKKSTKRVKPSTGRNVERTRRRRAVTRNADAKSRWRVSDDVIARRLGDEVIVVQLKTDRVYALNDSAARIWELVASGRSVREIQRAVAEEFAVDPAILERSIRRLLSRLNSRRLLDVRARGS